MSFLGKICNNKIHILNFEIISKSKGIKWSASGERSGMTKKMEAFRQSLVVNRYKDQCSLNLKEILRRYNWAMNIIIKKFQQLPKKSCQDELGKL